MATSCCYARAVLTQQGVNLIGWLYTVGALGQFNGTARRGAALKPFCAGRDLSRVHVHYCTCSFEVFNFILIKVTMLYLT